MNVENVELKRFKIKLYRLCELMMIVNYDILNVLRKYVL